MKNSEEIIKGLEKAYLKLIEFKKYKKSPMVISKDGKVIEVPYEEIKNTSAPVYSK
jgi:hypothetical protein